VETFCGKLCGDLNNLLQVLGFSPTKSTLFILQKWSSCFIILYTQDVWVA